MDIKIKCAGKLNLSLNVLSKEQNGYHKIDSIMQSVDIFDYMYVKKRNDNKINITFKSNTIDVNQINVNDNSVIKAINLVKQIKHDFGLDIIIEKNIFLCGGMGGSSANSAGILFILDQFFNVLKDIDPLDIALKVGSDVPFMIFGGLQRVTDFGQTLQNLITPPPMTFLVINCLGTKCTSKEIYTLFDTLPPPKSTNNTLLSNLLITNPKKAITLFSNDLTLSASTLSPNIKSALTTHKSATLTGSGNCIFIPNLKSKIPSKIPSKTPSQLHLNPLNKSIYII